eukprot:scaffold1603_cov45-Attheya_sp.AAC.2
MSTTLVRHLTKSSSANKGDEKHGTVTLIMAMATAGFAAVTIVYVRHKQKRMAAWRERNKSKASGDPSKLEEEFEKVATSVSKLSSIGQGDRLMLYGLYKQALLGDRDRPGFVEPPPSQFNIVAHAKYTAWGKFAGISKPVAMINYIEASNHFIHGGGDHFDDNSDIIYENDNGEEDSSTAGTDASDNYGNEVSGLGLRPSQMAYSENDVSGDDRSIVGDPNSKLRKAATNDNVPSLKEALEEGASVNHHDEETGETALHFAADRGFLRSTLFLLKAGADPNSVDTEGISVLQAAVIGGSIPVVQKLLEAGADPDNADEDGDTPHTCAQDDGDPAMLALFS